MVSIPFSRNRHRYRVRVRYRSPPAFSFTPILILTQYSGLSPYLDIYLNVDYYSYSYPYHNLKDTMRTVQMTLDESLVRSVDRAAKQTHTTRSAFTRSALRAALAKFNASRLERQHHKGYENRPANKAEFSVWEDEQVWGEE